MLPLLAHNSIIFISSYHLKQAETAVLCAYVENQAILEFIRLYRASQCKHTQEQVSRTLYGPTVLSFVR